MTPATSTPRLSGAQKAALLVLGLDEAVASDVLRHLEEDEIRRLTEETDRLDPIPLDAMEFVFEDFERRLRDPIPPRAGGAYLRKLTSGLLGQEKAQALFAPPEAQRPAIDVIKAAHPTTLAELLAEEQPQVAAVIVSQLPRDQASKVLMAMHAERQVDILARITTLRDVPEQVVQMASEALARAIESAGGGDSVGDRKPFDGVAFTAGLLNELPPGDTERLLGTMQEEHGELAPRIREAMFTFEDLGRLPSRSLQVLMREIPSDALLIALKTASEGLREHFLTAVSTRAAAAMREELAGMPPTRLAEVETAQREIIEAAMRLMAEGRLVVPGRQEKMV